MKILLLVFLFFSFRSEAFENSFLAPIGAYEAITGNTGIGRDGSVGSVLLSLNGKFPPHLGAFAFHEIHGG